MIQDLAFAAPDALSLGTSRPTPPAASLSDVIQNPSKLTVPFDVTTLKELHPGSNGKLIVHIQDAHANYSGQMSMAKALDQMMTNYGQYLVLAEGASKDVTLSELRPIADDATWKIAARRFLQDSVIAGEEYLNLTSKHPMKIRGVEYQVLYDQALETYANLVEKRKTILVYLHRIHASLDRLKAKHYSEALLAYEKKTRGPEGEMVDLTAQFDELMKLTGPANVDLTAFEEVTRLKTLKDTEKSISFDRANLEQEKLLAELSAKGQREKVDAYLKSSKKTKNLQVSQSVLLGQLFELAGSQEIQAAAFPELLKYSSYLKAFSELDLEAVMREVELLEDTVYKNLLPAEDGRKLRAIDRFVGLLDKAYRIKMSSSDFRTLAANKDDFQTESWEAFLNDQLAKLEYFDDLIFFKPYFEEAAAPLFDFYKLVDARDLAFLENTNRIMEEEKSSMGYLIAGGYHTEHLMQLFKDAGYSIVVLTPVVEFETDQTLYEKMLLMPFMFAMREKEKKERQLAKAKDSEASVMTLKPNELTENERVFGRLPETYRSGWPGKLNGNLVLAQGAKLAAKNEGKNNPSEDIFEYFQESGLSEVLKNKLQDGILTDQLQRGLKSAELIQIPKNSMEIEKLSGDKKAGFLRRRHTEKEAFSLAKALQRMVGMIKTGSTSPTTPSTEKQRKASGAVGGFGSSGAAGQRYEFGPMGSNYKIDPDSVLLLYKYMLKDLEVRPIIFSMPVKINRQTQKSKLWQSFRQKGMLRSLMNGYRMLRLSLALNRMRSQRLALIKESRAIRQNASQLEGENVQSEAIITANRMIGMAKNLKRLSDKTAEVMAEEAVNGGPITLGSFNTEYGMVEASMRKELETYEKEGSLATGKTSQIMGAKLAEDKGLTVKLSGGYDAKKIRVGNELALVMDGSNYYGNLENFHAVMIRGLLVAGVNYVEGDFNRTIIQVRNREETYSDFKTRFDAESKRRYAEWKASPEGQASMREQARQAEVAAQQREAGRANYAQIVKAIADGQNRTKPAVNAAGGALMRMEVGSGAALELYSKGITEVPAQALAVGVSTEVSVGVGATGAVARAVASAMKVSEDVVYENIYPEANKYAVGDAVAIPIGFALPNGATHVVSAMIHSYGDKSKSREPVNPTESSIRSSVRNAIKSADSEGLESIAFVGLGTGLLAGFGISDISNDQIALVMVDQAKRSLLSGDLKNLQTVRFAIPDRSLLAQFAEAFNIQGAKLAAITQKQIDQVVEAALPKNDQEREQVRQQFISDPQGYLTSRIKQLEKASPPNDRKLISYEARVNLDVLRAVLKEINSQAADASAVVVGAKLADARISAPSGVRLAFANKYQEETYLREVTARADVLAGRAVHQFYEEKNRNNSGVALRPFAKLPVLGRMLMPITQWAEFTTPGQTKPMRIGALYRDFLGGRRRAAKTAGKEITPRQLYHGAYGHDLKFQSVADTLNAASINASRPREVVLKSVRRYFGTEMTELIELMLDRGYLTSQDGQWLVPTKHGESVIIATAADLASRGVVRNVDKTFDVATVSHENAHRIYMSDAEARAKIDAYFDEILPATQPELAAAIRDFINSIYTSADDSSLDAESRQKRRYLRNNESGAYAVDLRSVIIDLYRNEADQPGEQPAAEDADKYREWAEVKQTRDLWERLEKAFVQDAGTTVVRDPDSGAFIDVQLGPALLKIQNDLGQIYKESQPENWQLIASKPTQRVVGAKLAEVVIEGFTVTKEYIGELGRSSIVTLPNGDTVNTNFVKHIVSKPYLKLGQLVTLAYDRNDPNVMKIAPAFRRGKSDVVIENFTVTKEYIGELGRSSIVTLPNGDTVNTNFVKHIVSKPHLKLGQLVTLAYDRNDPNVMRTNGAKLAEAVRWTGFYGVEINGTTYSYRQSNGDTFMTMTQGLSGEGADFVQALRARTSSSVVVPAVTTMTSRLDFSTISGVGMSDQQQAQMAGKYSFKDVFYTLAPIGLGGTDQKVLETFREAQPDHIGVWTPNQAMPQEGRIVPFFSADVLKLAQENYPGFEAYLKSLGFDPAILNNAPAISIDMEGVENSTFSALVPWLGMVLSDMEPDKIAEQFQRLNMDFGSLLSNLGLKGIEIEVVTALSRFNKKTVQINIKFSFKRKLSGAEALMMAKIMAQAMTRWAA